MSQECSSATAQGYGTAADQTVCALDPALPKTGADLAPWTAAAVLVVAAGVAVRRLVSHA